jgi:signal transduction histidine kinase
VIVPSDQDTYYRCRKAMLDTGSPQECELQMLKRGGVAFWVHMRIAPSRDSRGIPAQRMVLSDITERKRLDSALLVKNHELQLARAIADNASHAKSDFLANMSHELRSPLNAILGFAQMMEMAQPAPNLVQASHLKQILRAGWHLLDLIGEILDLTSIESGQLKLVMEPVPLAAALADSQTAAAVAAHAKGIQLQFGPVDSDLSVQADRTRLLRVVAHLLSNAIKYNRHGGAVDVICSEQPQHRLRICVRDTGFGMSEDKLTQLFQPFNRLGRETTAEEGTGVGLALSKRLVEMMGGSIGARSTVGTGSEFWIELALADEAPQGPK